MTAANPTRSASIAAEPGLRDRRPNALREGLLIAGRDALHQVREPWGLLFGLAFNIILILLFAFLFGGAIEIPGGGDYIAFLLPGMFALTMLFGLEATIAGPFVKVEVPDGAAFVPRLVREVDAPIESVGFRSPSLDDVFIGLTGHAIREDAGAGGGMPAFLRQRIFGGGR